MIKLVIICIRNCNAFTVHNFLDTSMAILVAQSSVRLKFRITGHIGLLINSLIFSSLLDMDNSCFFYLVQNCILYSRWSDRFKSFLILWNIIFCLDKLLTKCDEVCRTLIQVLVICEFFFISFVTLNFSLTVMILTFTHKKNKENQ